MNHAVDVAVGAVVSGATSFGPVEVTSVAAASGGTVTAASLAEFSAVAAAVAASYIGVFNAGLRIDFGCVDDVSLISLVPSMPGIDRAGSGLESRLRAFLENLRLSALQLFQTLTWVPLRLPGNSISSRQLTKLVPFFSPKAWPSDWSRRDWQAGPFNLGREICNLHTESSLFFGWRDCLLICCRRWCRIRSVQYLNRSSAS